MKHLRTLRGFRPLTFVPEGILLAKGYELYAANLDCTSLRPVGAVPHPAVAAAARRFRTLERILRLGVRFGCRIDDNRYLLAEGNRLWLLELPSGELRLDHIVENGSRPLCISRIRDVKGFSDCACYGEYSENVPKNPVNLWVRSSEGAWRTAHTFAKGKIEHIHAVIPDESRGVVFILTGDFGDSAGIWAARRDFSQVFPVLVGKQDFRCCWMEFCGDQIVYATDSPLEFNSLRRLVLPQSNLQSEDDWRGARSESCMEISGSSIYACRVQNQVIFSTTVEPGLRTGKALHDWFDRRPGPGIKGMYADLVVGTEARGFALAGRWLKDRWPGRLCEFGSISFPVGPNPGRCLYAYFTGVADGDGSMGVFELE
jgi:hypothetical protein